ncbi:MAG: hypothetical protein ACRDH5_02975 [bacterium]
MSGPHVELKLPESERALAASLATAWRDFLYTPGPGFTSPLDPGAYRSSFVVVPVEGAPVRVSSLATPVFGGELCRLRLEPLERYRPESLGSFFEPSRTGTVYAFAPERGSGAARAPERAEWRYEGPPLVSRIGRVTSARLLRERGRGADFSWEADRGILLTGVDGVGCLLLSSAETSETALFLPSVGLHRALLERDAAPSPGVTARGLLGYGDWPADLDVAVELLRL